MDRLSVHGATSHVPAFLGKLWRIVDDPSTNDLICWSESGKSFIIRNQSKFARELLPLYYKHNNMASFVRQLNMYGFHKVISVEQGGLRLERDEMEFAHAYFVQGNEEALEYIKRKISTAKIEELKTKPESLNKVLIDVRQMKGRQEAMDSKLVSVKRENEALWRELSQLRQKHSKQQQIVTKLLQFLVSMMSSQSHRISFKRRMPLMLSDVDGNTKPAKLSRPNKSSVVGTSGNSGPVIHEVIESEEQPTLILSMPDEARNERQPTDGGLDSELMQVEDLLQTAVSETIGSTASTPSPITITAVQEGSPVVAGNEQDSENSPGPESPYVTDLFSIQTMDSNSGSPLPITTEDMASLGMSMTGEEIPTLEESMQLCRKQELPMSNAVVNPKVVLPEDLDGHLGEVQLGLDSLKDLLQGTAYNIDSSTLSGLFGTHENDFPLYELSRLDTEKERENKDIPLGITFREGEDANPEAGSDVSYNPCLFELAEDDSHFFENPSDNIFLDDELDMMLTTDRNKLNGGGLSA